MRTDEVVPVLAAIAPLVTLVVVMRAVARSQTGGASTAFGRLGAMLGGFGGLVLGRELAGPIIGHPSAEALTLVQVAGAEVGILAGAGLGLLLGKALAGSSVRWPRPRENRSPGLLTGASGTETAGSQAAESFPVISPKIVKSLARAAAGFWVATALVAVVEYCLGAGWSKAGPHGRPFLTANGDFVYLAVFAVGVTALFLGLLPGACTAVLVSPEGVSLRRWSSIVWHLPWARLSSWRREVNTQGSLLAIAFTDTSGAEYRAGVYALADIDYQPMIEALRRHSPKGSEQPEAAFFRLNCLSYAVLAILAVLIIVLIYVWR